MNDNIIAIALVAKAGNVIFDVRKRIFYEATLMEEDHVLCVMVERTGENTFTPITWEQFRSLKFNTEKLYQT